MVVVTVTPLTKLPLAEAGFARKIDNNTAVAFSINCSAPNEALPTGTWIIPALSTRNSSLPALISLTALPISMLTVPVFGFGMRPRGPKILPIRPTAPIISGVATVLSNSSHPSLIFLIISSLPTKSAPVFPCHEARSRCRGYSDRPRADRHPSGSPFPRSHRTWRGLYPLPSVDYLPTDSADCDQLWRARHDSFFHSHSWVHSWQNFAVRSIVTAVGSEQTNPRLPSPNYERYPRQTSPPRRDLSL